MKMKSSVPYVQMEYQNPNKVSKRAMKKANCVLLFEDVWPTNGQNL